MTDLDPKLTFDTFVVGPANRLASAAARRAADSPGTSYNPLFIYAASGLGKSHILTAIAHHGQRADPRVRIRYQALEGYVDELAEALGAGSREALRERYRDLDILLLDDVQFLAGQPEAQEMLLSTLDALSASESQIVLASDRPPAEINGLDARLLSRFSGGLIVDIGVPEYETRVAILRRKVEERGQTLDAGVAEAIARYPLKNVRELGGALNRVLAVQELEERRVKADEIPSIMGDETERATEGAEPGGFVDAVGAGGAPPAQPAEAKWREAFRKTADALEAEGFVVQRLRERLDGEEPEAWEELLDAFRADVQRLREIDGELDRLDNPWPDAAQGVLRDPERLEEAESLLASVRERTRPFPDPPDGPLLENLAGRFPGLALKAAEQLVASEKPEYNPLFLWSDPPDICRELLMATARTHRSTQPDNRMALTSLTDFAEDFIRALSSGVAGAWRERWWTVDLLLVHGVQALSGTERAQDEFFHLFEALKRRGSRVLIAADRPPSGIARIDERLRSRFEGGLVLEVEARGGAQPEERPDEHASAPRGRTGAHAGAEGGPAEAGGATIPPLDELDLGEGRGGLFVDPEAGGEAEEDRRDAGSAAPERMLQAVPGGHDPAGGGGPGRWLLSREKVVWRWPDLDDRLVEDLE